ncbi:hypothetical protein AAHE18_17G108900 [Arachis hypogaea]
MNYIINYDFWFDLPQISKEWPKNGQMSCSRGFSREGEGPIYYKVREVYFETSLSFSLSDSLTCLTEYCTQKDTSFPSI